MEFIIQWVPAHFGVRDNELVDEAAKASAENKNVLHELTKLQWATLIHISNQFYLTNVL